MSVFLVLQDNNPEEIKRLRKKLEREEKEMIARGASKDETKKIRHDIQRLKRPL